AGDAVDAVAGGEDDLRGDDRSRARREELPVVVHVDERGLLISGGPRAADDRLRRAVVAGKFAGGLTVVVSRTGARARREDADPTKAHRDTSVHPRSPFPWSL